MNDQSAARKDVLDDFLAGMLESAGLIDEARALYRRLAQMNPTFRDASFRLKELTARTKFQRNGKRITETNGS